ncbi:MAG TPA: phosphoribosyltransferase family protein [Acidimicrobiales bacterium]|nr:phosphoribosyltransferase family protein [Acidimicrobiales bacterium]
MLSGALLILAGLITVAAAFVVVATLAAVLPGPPALLGATGGGARPRARAPARRRFLRRVGESVAPPRCGACARPGPSPCAGCLAALRRPPPLPPPAGLSSLVALLAYDGPGRELVARIKYRNARASLPWLAAALAAHVDAADIDIVTWVPTTARRRRGRGFDQARLLAEAVAGELGRPCVGLLHRGPGPPQTGRSAEERRRRPNLRPNARARTAVGARVLLVDDVCTTGTTLAAAAHALRSGGAGVVIAAVAARTLRHGLVGPPLKVVIRRTDPLG